MRLATVQKRNAFTLVELLVVIAIIVILMALTVGVISKVYVYLDEVKVNTEVNRMAQACEQFKATFGRYPPSRIILCDNPVVLGQIINGTQPAPPNSGLTNAQFQQLGAFSAEYLTSIFQGINIGTAPSVIRDWNGNGSIDNQLLDGTECLVYFLGGMRYGGAAPTGFNTDKSNPTFQTNSTRLGPFFEFEPSRLAVSPKPDYPLYKDVYGSAYLYFASVNTNVNSYRNPFFPFVNSIGNDCHSYLYSLNPTAVLFAPYFSSTVPVSGPGSWSAAGSFKFLKSDTYQIISAGKDKQYGTGGQWSQVDPEQSAFLPPGVMSGPPYNVTITTDMIQANYDNITNFAGGRVVPK
jgi:prepilin-type N-terminal cleavage/methylation domain-containing protein